MSSPCDHDPGLVTEEEKVEAILHGYQVAHTGFPDYPYECRLNGELIYYSSWRNEKDAWFECVFHFRKQQIKNHLTKAK